MSTRLSVEFDRRFSYPLFLALTVSLLPGCTISRTFLVTADCKYKGIKLQKWSQNSVQENGTIRILLIHGMNNHPFGFAGKPDLDGCTTYAELQQKLSGNLTLDERQRLRTRAIQSQFDYFIKRLASKLEVGEEAPPDPKDFKIIRASDDGPALGYLFTRSFGATGPRHRALTFYIANWALSACVSKEQQFGGWTENTKSEKLKGDRDFDSRLDKHRAAINKSLKWNTIDWGLGDAAFYLSSTGEKFRQVVSAGVQRLQSETGPHDRVAIVSASLGSTITLDTVSEMLKSGGARSLFTKSDEFAEQPRQQPRAVFYMFANQFALLTLGRPQKERENPLIELDNALKKAGARTTIQIYAFTDPNDILSLPLNTKLSRVSICNVYVRNPGFTVGVFMHPGDAHGNYEKNNHVIATLLNGPEETPEQPDDCLGNAQSRVFP
jgi:hypothetical protein